MGLCAMHIYIERRSVRTSSRIAMAPSLHELHAALLIRGCGRHA